MTEQQLPGPERRAVGVGRQGQPRTITTRQLPDDRIHLQIGADEPVILSAEEGARHRNHVIDALPKSWSYGAEEPGEGWVPDFDGRGKPKRGPR